MGLGRWAGKLLPMQRMDKASLAEAREGRGGIGERGINTVFLWVDGCYFGIVKIIQLFPLEASLSFVENIFRECNLQKCLSSTTL